ncbi:MAG: hypothetical protein ABIH39_03550 [Candidatus Margulisiibacteriota bacterium]
MINKKVIQYNINSHTKSFSHEMVSTPALSVKQIEHVLSEAKTDHEARNAISNFLDGYQLSRQQKNILKWIVLFSNLFEPPDQNHTAYKYVGKCAELPVISISASLINEMADTVFGLQKYLNESAIIDISKLHKLVISGNHPVSFAPRANADTPSKKQKFILEGEVHFNNQYNKTIPILDGIKNIIKQTELDLSEIRLIDVAFTYKNNNAKDGRASYDIYSESTSNDRVRFIFQKTNRTVIIYSEKSLSIRIKSKKPDRSQTTQPKKIITSMGGIIIPKNWKDIVDGKTQFIQTGDGRWTPDIH